MSDGTEGKRAPSDQTRQIAIDALMEHFANDVLDVDEFERRVESAHKASTSDELKELLQDLPGGSNLPAARDESPSTEIAGTREYSVTSSDQIEDRQYVVACMGGSSRRGRWTPARKTHAVAVMGGAELDFREAVFGPGVTEVHVWAMWGGVDIIVPPGINVESRGIALLGGFDHAADTPTSGDPGQPTLRITGLAVMAGVDISVRYPGETARDARRRRRQERREKRRRLRSG
ncbi:MAG: DUF1707 domain-containing protein [Longimicrobiales bacterium]|nr:DUF1707 domain-containing protein [Longimicrobiales bacterium]